jgi:hypothetical protein
LVGGIVRARWAGGCRTPRTTGAARKAAKADPRERDVRAVERSGVTVDLDAISLRKVVANTEMSAAGRTGVAYRDITKHQRCFVRGYGQRPARRQLRAGACNDPEGVVFEYPVLE